MSPTKTNDTDLLEALFLLFRQQGFEGASLTRISQATGLQRASLYHRFPGGKAEMAVAVLRHVHARFGAEVLEPLQASKDGGPGLEARLRKAARGLDAFYESGACSCLFDTLSLGDGTPEIRDSIADSLAATLHAFNAAAREAGQTPAAAKRAAQDALIRIQGALVVARVSGDRQPFQRVVRELPALLMGEAA